MVKITGRKHKKPNKKTKISIRRRKKCSSNIKEENGNAANGNEFNKLSADVLTSIFLKCPLKTLSISRCISKSWNEFIISPLFIRSHDQKQQLMENGPQLLYVETKPCLPRSGRLRLEFVSVDMEGRNEELYTVTAHPDDKIYGSHWRVCSGLVCLSTHCRIYLCNPAIHQLRELSNCSPSAIPGYERFGFGYLDSRKEYKVVHFFYMGPPCLPDDVQLAQLRCEVFTLNGGGISNSRWKETAEAPPYHPYFPGLLVNECMYWLARDKIDYFAQPRAISFDFENEKFIAISCPSAFVTLCGMYLMDLKGTVCLADHDNLCRSSILDLWILKDKISCTWVKEYSINLVSFESKNIKGFYLTWNEEIIFAQRSGMIVFYDIKRNCFREVKKFGIRSFQIYSKTLFSLGP